MRKVKRIKILIAGLAAFVNGVPGEVDVLLPRVDSAHWLEVHNLYLPEHHVLVGYLGRQDTCKDECLDPCNERCSGNVECRKGCAERCIGPGLVGSGTCWQRLQRVDLYFETAEAKPPQEDPTTRARRFFGLGSPRRLPETWAQIRDISWIADMSTIGGQPVGVHSQSLGIDWHDTIEARAHFPYTQRSVCRLAGSFDRANQQFFVSVFAFRSSPWADDGPDYRQALATATMLELELQPELPSVKLCRKTIGRGLIDCDLELSADEDGVVEVAIVQQVPNGSAVSHALLRALGLAVDGVDDHFRTYYHLLRNPDETAGQVPYEVGPSAGFTADQLDQACRTPFLRRPDLPFEVPKGAEFRPSSKQVVDQVDGDEAALGSLVARLMEMTGGGEKRFLIFPRNVPATTPKEYQASTLLGPPLCPQISFTTSGALGTASP